MSASRFKIRVGVMVWDVDNRLLLVRQNRRDFWVLPGGTLDPGESLGQCAVREIQEEAGLTLTLGPLRFVSDFLPHDADRQAVDVVFEAIGATGVLTPEASGNIDEIGFFSLTEAQQLVLKPVWIMQPVLAAWETGRWPDVPVYCDTTGLS